jgi:flagellar biosynthesis/type III secretory pathway M-ring protein FliF/YscJ
MGISFPSGCGCCVAVVDEVILQRFRRCGGTARGGGVAAISGEPSLKEDELSDDAPAGIGTDAAAILGDEDASGALEGSEELEIARLQREIANSVQSNPEIVVELMRTWLGSED